MGLGSLIVKIRFLRVLAAVTNSALAALLRNINFTTKQRMAFCVSMSIKPVPGGIEEYGIISKGSSWTLA